MAERIIIRQGSRILGPLQAEKLFEQMNPGYLITCKALLHTGLRLVELWALRDNPEWYNEKSRVIDLPKEGSAKKQKIESVDRTIRLTEEGCKAVSVFLQVRPPVRDSDAFGKALRRYALKAGIGIKGISAKIFRKWLISWLVECKQDLNIDALDITANMGHDLKTLQKHYLGIGFSEDDHIAMVRFLRGWKR